MKVKRAPCQAGKASSQPFTRLHACRTANESIPARPRFPLLSHLDQRRAPRSITLKAMSALRPSHTGG
jgi:hypothetical protein